MAVKTTKVSTSLTLKMKSGVDKNGKDIIKNMKISKLKVDASNDDLYSVGTAYSGLIKYPVTGFIKGEQYKIEVE